MSWIFLEAWPSPRPALSYQVRSFTGAGTWQLEMVWGSLDSLFSDHAAGNGRETRVASPLAVVSHGDKTVTVNDITVKNLHCSIFSLLSVFPPRSVTGWSEPSRYPTNVSLSELIRLLCAPSTLTCWGFISWPVVFLSLQVGFWHNLRSHFPILLRWWGAVPFFMTK